MNRVFIGDGGLKRGLLKSRAIRLIKQSKRLSPLIPIAFFRKNETAQPTNYAKVFKLMRNTATKGSTNSLFCIIACGTRMIRDSERQTESLQNSFA